MKRTARLFSFPARQGQEGDGPHLQGDAVCLACGHSWQAAIAVGGAVNGMECSACGANKGLFKNFVRHGVPNWTCANCQGSIFAAILRDEVPTIACATCGKLSDAMDLFNK